MSLKFIFFLYLIQKIILFDQEKIDKVKEVLEWAKKQNITIDESLTLNPVDENHNLPFFTSNANIPINKTIISIPKNMIISQELISNFYKNKKKGKYYNLWDKILNLENDYLHYLSTKELFYMTIMIEHSMRIKKGKFYKEFKPYFNLYEYTNLDNFPIFYSQEELSLLKGTNLYEEIKRAKESLENEEKVLFDEFNFKKTDQENFLKYRVLILANSIIHENRTILIPFLDLFSKDMFEDFIDVEYLYNKAMKRFVIRTTKEIKKGKEIVINSKPIPNTSALLYFGYTSEKNNAVGRFIIEVVNNIFRKRLNWDDSIKLINSSYDIGSNYFIDNIIGSYQDLKMKLSDYKNKEYGEYLLMKENILDYLKIYDKFTDEMYSKFFYGQKKITNVKRILFLEKQVLEIRINQIDNIINEIKKNSTKQTDL